MAKIHEVTEIIAKKTSDGKLRALECDDNGNLKVSPQGAAGGDGAILDGVSSAIRATVRTTSGDKSLAVSLTNAAGAEYDVASGLTDTQLRASAVPVTIPVPTPVSDNAGSLT